MTHHLRNILLQLLFLVVEKIALALAGHFANLKVSFFQPVILLVHFLKETP